MSTSFDARSASMIVKVLRGLAWLSLIAAVVIFVALTIVSRAPLSTFPFVLPLLAGFVILFAAAQLFSLLEDIAASQRAIAAALERRGDSPPPG